MNVMSLVLIYRLIKNLPLFQRVWFISVVSDIRGEVFNLVQPTIKGRGGGPVLLPSKLFVFYTKVIISTHKLKVIEDNIQCQA